MVKSPLAPLGGHQSGEQMLGSDALPLGLEPQRAWALLRGSDAFFPALIQSLDAAQTEIRLETYIFDFSLGAIEVAQALERAAGRGVNVMVMLDAFGTPGIPKAWQERWGVAGMQFLFYSPLMAFVTGWPANWRRLHRKLCVIDEVCGFCGGVNLLDDHWDPHAHQRLHPARLDFTLQVWGPVVQEIHQQMTTLWTHVALTQNWRTNTKANATQQVLQAWWVARAAQTAPASVRQVARAEPFVHDDFQAQDSMHLVLRDNVRHRWQIQASYLAAIGRARKEIWIANAFFFPSTRLLLALCAAAKRGVSVHVLLSGLAEYVWLYRATWHLLAVLIKSGVQVHEYHASFLHAKVATVDEDWSTVGSSNLDPLSLMMAREANIVTHSRALAQELKAHIQESTATGSTPVKRADIEGRSCYNRGLDWLAYGSVLLALKLARVHY
jgi:cardiolipin synthase